MPARIGKATLFLFIAYWIVTILGILLTVLFAAVFQPATPQELGVPVTQAPAYTMTLPYHPLLNLLVWPLFGWWYLRSLSPEVPRLREALRLGIYWTVITMVVDLVGWVLIPHIWRMTFQEFYVGYQPWITLIYLVIFASPIIVGQLVKPGLQKKEPDRIRKR